MPDARLKTGETQSHWSDVSDERLIDLDLEIDNPETLAGLVRQVPPDYADAHVEFKYDLRGLDAEFTCVHGNHHHKAGFVMRIGDRRFMVGWICGKTIYNEDFDRYTADFDAAVVRQDALRRVREIRAAFSQFSEWLDAIVASGAVRTFSNVIFNLRQSMPFVVETLKRANGGQIQGVQMPRHLSLPANDVEAEFERLINAAAAVASSLTGSYEQVAGSIGAIRTEIGSLIRRADLLVARLTDLEAFFQPAILHAICQHAEAAVPTRRRHFAGLMKLSTRNVTIELPRNFIVPSRGAIEVLQQAVSN